MALLICLNMKKLLFLILTCVIFFSCNESPETKFEKDGVSFICPQGWAITDQEDFDGEGYYISIEKDGFNSSGLATITWYDNFDNSNFNFEENLRDWEESLKEQWILDASNIIFGDYYDNTFNNSRSMSTNYTMNLLGIPHEGTVYVFHAGNKRISVLLHEAIEDKAKNKKGFELIENSFKSE